MKAPFTNLFTAPDASDILKDRRLTFRNLILMASSGIVFVCTLLGGYVLGTWFLTATLPHTEPETASIEEVMSEDLVQKRLNELGNGAVPSPQEVLERSRELGGTQQPAPMPVNEEAVNARLKELGGN